MNITPQASSSSQAFLADTKKAETTEEAIFNGIAHYLGNSQISSAEKIGLCSRLITVANNHLHFTASPGKIDDKKIIHPTRLTMQEGEQKVNPQWQKMLENKQKIIKYLRIRDFLPALLGDWVLTTEEFLLLKGMVKNSDFAETRQLLDILAKKDRNAYKAMIEFIESEESLQGLLPYF